MKTKKRSPLKPTIEPQYLEAVRQVLRKDYVSITPTIFEPDEWHGRVFLYLPPEWSEIDRLCDKWKHEVEVGHIKEGIVLLESRTETLWFRQVATGSDAIVFLTKTADQKTPPLAALYVGPYDGTFTVVFRDFGWPAQHQNTWGE